MCSKSFNIFHLTTDYYGSASMFGECRLNNLTAMIESKKDHIPHMTVKVMTHGSTFGMAIAAIKIAARLRWSIPSDMTLR